MRRATGLVLLAVAIPAMSGAAPAAADSPTADQVLAKIGFVEADRRRILAGQFVERSLPSATERDLAVGLAFLVRKPPAQLEIELIRDALLAKADPNTLTVGDLEGAASLAALDDLGLSPDEKQVYLHAEPGEAVNLSPDEIAGLHGLADGAGGVDAAVRRILLARYRAYRSRGLDGIAPYARAEGKLREPGEELRRASEAARASQAFAPAFHHLLLDYPDARVPEFEEAFHWSRYRAHGTPTLILTHVFSAAVDRAVVFVQRQYYVSRGYNAEQAVAGLLPVQEGTLVAYTNHTFTDQVSGFGGEARRSIGERVMGSELEALFERLTHEVAP